MNMVARQAARRPAEHGTVPPVRTEIQEFIGRLAAGVEDASQYSLLTPREEVKTVGFC